MGKKSCIKCGGSMKKERKRMRICSSCKDKEKTKKSTEPEIKKVEDRIPNLNFFPKVKIYASNIGIKGFRFGTVKQLNNVWEKEMSGVEATQLLRSIKSKNRDGRLISKILPKK